MLTFKLQLISFKLLDSDSKFELYVCTCSILSCGVAQFNFVRIFFVVLKGTGRKKVDLFILLVYHSLNLEQRYLRMPRYYAGKRISWG